MLRIEIGSKEYDLPNEWKDITMSKLLESQKLLDSMPENLRKHTFPDNKKSTPKKIKYDDLKVWEFYLKWFEFFVKCPDAKKIRNEDLKAAYVVLSIFMFAPKEMEHDEFIKFKGKYYDLPTAEHLANGMTKHMADSTYEEWVEGVQLTSQLARMKKQDLTVLPTLTATFYRPRQRKLKNLMRATVEPYIEEEVKKRAELFLELPMNVVWGAYFFLLKHLTELQNGLQTSLKERVAVVKT